ncbi:MAG: ABC transporter permease [Pyrinomonadaceae bacterium]|nr:ABC transporter permease [Pyrinomonadaceae bacterium]
MIKSFWKNRNLIQTLVKREIVGRYRGSLLGILWSFFNPLLMLAIYTFVFGVIFKSRWRSDNTSQTEFALILFAGLIIFNLFAECVNRAPSLILSNVNYVKKVVFPLEILPWVALGSVGFHGLVSLVVWLIAYLILFGIPHFTVLFFPLVIIPLLLFIIGFTWLLASLGVYLRDVSQIVGILVTMVMFLSPIFYPAANLPEGIFRNILTLNPLTTVVDEFREVLFWGNYPDLNRLSVSFVSGLFTAWLGFVWFQKTRKGFADVI